MSSSQPAEVDREAVEGLDVDATRDLGRARLVDRLADDRQADLRWKHGRLVRVDENPQDHAIENGRGALDDVEVAERDRVERARVDGYLHLRPPQAGAVSASAGSAAGL